VKKQRIVKSLSSVLFGIVLLGALAVASIWGSLLSSNPNIGVEGARRLIFNTWWYTALLGLLVLNLLLCSWDRTLWAIKLWRRASYQQGKAFYLGQESARQIALDNGLEPAVRQLKHHYTTCRVKGNSVHAQKGLVGRLGAPVAHLGVIFVLVGGLVRIVADRTGYAVFDGQVIIPESGVVDYYSVRDRSSKGSSDENSRKIALGFRLRCLDFDEEKFPHSEVPRAYTSQIEIQDGDTRVVGTINMAQPFVYKGYKFHQTSFAPDRQVERGMVEIMDASGGRRLALLDVSPRTPVPVPETPYWFETDGFSGGSRWELIKNGLAVAEGGLETPGGRSSFTVERIVSDFRIGANREVFSASDEWKNPAVLIAYHEGEKTIGEDWFFYRPEFRSMSVAKKGDLEFQFVDYRPVEKPVSNEPNSAFEVKIQVSRKTGRDMGSYWVGTGEKVYLDQPRGDDKLTSMALAESNAALPPEIETASSRSAGPFIVRYQGPTMGYDTILGVVKDPSITITYVGCILVVLGALLAFFTTYRQLWGYYDADEKRLYLALSVRGRSERPLKEFNRIVRLLKERQVR
jgi:cytochrome c biogenesis protein ResB